MALYKLCSWAHFAAVLTTQLCLASHASSIIRRDSVAITSKGDAAVPSQSLLQVPTTEELSNMDKNPGVHEDSLDELDIVRDGDEPEEKIGDERSLITTRVTSRIWPWKKPTPSPTPPECLSVKIMKSCSTGYVRVEPRRTAICGKFFWEEGMCIEAGPGFPFSGGCYEPQRRRYHKKEPSHWESMGCRSKDCTSTVHMCQKQKQKPNKPPK